MRRRLNGKGKGRGEGGRAAPGAQDPEGLPAEVVSFLFDQLSSEDRSERAWEAMFSAEADDDQAEVGRRAPADGVQKAKRWKFFGK